MPRDVVDVSSAGRARAEQSDQRSPDELRLIDELRSRDTEVRQHEAAHQAAGGALAGGASFTYQRGPDGKSYAVGGEVPIDLSTGRTPDETIQRARQVRAAALAPAQPSSQDLHVAAEASALEQAALLERMQQPRETHVHTQDGCASCTKNVAAYQAQAAPER